MKEERNTCFLGFMSTGGGVI